MTVTFRTTGMWLYLLEWINDVKFQKTWKQKNALSKKGILKMQTMKSQVSKIPLDVRYRRVPKRGMYIRII